MKLCDVNNCYWLVVKTQPHGIYLNIFNGNDIVAHFSLDKKIHIDIQIIIYSEKISVNFAKYCINNRNKNIGQMLCYIKNINYIELINKFLGKL